MYIFNEECICLYRYIKTLIIFIARAQQLILSNGHLVMNQTYFKYFRISLVRKLTRNRPFTLNIDV